MSLEKIKSWPEQESEESTEAPPEKVDKIRTELFEAEFKIDESVDLSKKART